MSRHCREEGGAQSSRSKYEEKETDSRKRMLQVEEEGLGQEEMTMLAPVEEQTPATRIRRSADEVREEEGGHLAPSILSVNHSSQQPLLLPGIHPTSTSTTTTTAGGSGTRLMESHQRNSGSNSLKLEGSRAEEAIMVLHGVGTHAGELPGDASGIPHQPRENLANGIGTGMESFATLHQPPAPPPPPSAVFMMDSSSDQSGSEMLSVSQRRSFRGAEMSALVASPVMRPRTTTVVGAAAAGSSGLYWEGGSSNGRRGHHHHQHQNNNHSNYSPSAGSPNQQLQALYMLDGGSSKSNSSVTNRSVFDAPSSPQPSSLPGVPLYKPEDGYYDAAFYLAQRGQALPPATPSEGGGTALWGDVEAGVSTPGAQSIAARSDATFTPSTCYVMNTPHSGNNLLQDYPRSPSASSGAMLPVRVSPAPDFELRHQRHSLSTSQQLNGSCFSHSGQAHPASEATASICTPQASGMVEGGGHDPLVNLVAPEEFHQMTQVAAPPPVEDDKEETIGPQSDPPSRQISNGDEAQTTTPLSPPLTGGETARGGAVPPVRQSPSSSVGIPQMGNRSTNPNPPRNPIGPPPATAGANNSSSLNNSVTGSFREGSNSGTEQPPLREGGVLTGVIMVQTQRAATTRGVVDSHPNMIRSGAAGESEITSPNNDSMREDSLPSIPEGLMSRVNLHRGGGGPPGGSNVTTARPSPQTRGLNTPGGGGTSFLALPGGGGQGGLMDPPPLPGDPSSSDFIYSNQAEASLIATAFRRTSSALLSNGPNNNNSSGDFDHTSTTSRGILATNRGGVRSPPGDEPIVVNANQARAGAASGSHHHQRENSVELTPEALFTISDPEGATRPFTLTPNSLLPPAQPRAPASFRMSESAIPSFYTNDGEEAPRWIPMSRAGSQIGSFLELESFMKSHTGSLYDINPHIVKDCLLLKLPIEILRYIIDYYLAIYHHNGLRLVNKVFNMLVTTNCSLWHRRLPFVFESEELEDELHRCRLHTVIQGIHEGELPMARLATTYCFNRCCHEIWHQNKILFHERIDQERLEFEEMSYASFVFQAMTYPTAGSTFFGTALMVLAFAFILTFNLLVYIELEPTYLAFLPLWCFFAVCYPLLYLFFCHSSIEPLVLSVIVSIGVNLTAILAYFYRVVSGHPAMSWISCLTPTLLCIACCATYIFLLCHRWIKNSGTSNAVIGLSVATALTPVFLLIFLLLFAAESDHSLVIPSSARGDGSSSSSDGTHNSGSPSPTGSDITSVPGVRDLLRTLAPGATPDPTLAASTLAPPSPYISSESQRDEDRPIEGVIRISGLFLFIFLSILITNIIYAIRKAGFADLRQEEGMTTAVIFGYLTSAVVMLVLAVLIFVNAQGAGLFIPFVTSVTIFFLTCVVNVGMRKNNFGFHLQLYPLNEA